MVVNNNISAIIANKHLLRNENSLSASMERLSSGYKINHAYDDPSGMAISNKMRAQIDGLDRASDNSSDGINVLNTADGAMNEITSMIQRMRELSVQAANDLNTDKDKEEIQLEISQLTEEIDRVSSTTEFNTKKLLDGSLDTRAYADNITRIQTSDTVEEGVYKLKVTQAATQTTLGLGFTVGSKGVEAEQAGQVVINGAVADITEGMTSEQVYEAIRNAAEKGNAYLRDGSSSSSMTISSTAYGSDTSVDISFSNSAVKSIFSEGKFKAGEDAQITLVTKDSAFKDHKQATVSCESDKVTISDTDGFEISFKLDAATTTNSTGTTNAAGQTYSGDLSIEVTDIGPMDLQIGANEGQQMTVRIAAMDSKSMYIDDVDVTKVGGADRAIAKYDDALNYVNNCRAKLGAYSNRLEHTVTSLDASEENITSSVSQIMDTDIADEMVEYTKDNVISQAATSALSQANELPQMALQLLQ